MVLPFTKMQGIGNDFVVVDCLAPDAPRPDTLQAGAVALCDRKFGVGADGVLLVLPSTTADFRMQMFNPDGSEAEMCGNGIRCFAKWVADRGHTDKRDLAVETGGGIKHLTLTVGADGTIDRVRVDMGKPGLHRTDLPMTGGDETTVAVPVTLDGETVTITGVSMGNPHAVFFADEATDALIDRIGPPVEVHPLFPRRINAHVVAIIAPDEIKMLTWERGAGRTLACGTGACACVVAAHLNGLTGRQVRVHLAGGDLDIDWADDDHVYMTGPAATVFEGEITLGG